jgi:hypothetical protein
MATGSPFDAALGSSDLPALFRRQFLDGDVVLEGVMERIWHRPPWIRPLLMLLARHDLLFPETGSNVHAALVITNGPGRQQWRRTFEFDSLTRRFDAVLLGEGDQVIEQLGRLHLRWVVGFERPATVHIRTAGGWVGFARRRIPLPRFLLPEVRAVEVTTGRSTLTATIEATHPLLGPFFGYSGTFRL